MRRWASPCSAVHCSTGRRLLPSVEILERTAGSSGAIRLEGQSCAPTRTCGRDGRRYRGGPPIDRRSRAAIDELGMASSGAHREAGRPGGDSRRRRAGGRGHDATPLSRSAEIPDSWFYALHSVDLARAVCDQDRPAECLQILDESERRPPAGRRARLARRATASTRARLARAAQEAERSPRGGRHVEGTELPRVPGRRAARPCRGVAPRRQSRGRRAAARRGRRSLRAQGQRRLRREGAGRARRVG